jgi:uncharacterized protein (TIGR00369 family)
MQALAWINRAPDGIRERAKRWAAAYLVPFNRASGIRVAEIAADSSDVMLTLQHRKRNQNLDGTVHGGVIMALAETVHGVAVMWQFPPHRYSMVTKQAWIEFLAPGQGQLQTRFHLDAEVRTRLRTELAERGRCEVTLESRVTGAGGADVARLKATYVVRRRTSQPGSRVAGRVASSSRHKGSRGSEVSS